VQNHPAATAGFIVFNWNVVSYIKTVLAVRTHHSWKFCEEEEEEVKKKKDEWKK